MLRRPVSANFACESIQAYDREIVRDRDSDGKSSRNRVLARRRVELFRVENMSGRPSVSGELGQPLRAHICLKCPALFSLTSPAVLNYHPLNLHGVALAYYVKFTQPVNPSPEST